MPVVVMMVTSAAGCGESTARESTTAWGGKVGGEWEGEARACADGVATGHFRGVRDLAGFVVVGAKHGVDDVAEGH